jgi:rhodanese-related sulfurtransferase
METDRLKALQNSTENVIVIDVREDAERAISYIPHSITQKIFEENQQQEL